MKKKTIVAGIVLLLTAGTIWALRTPATDPQVAKVQQLQAGLRAENLSPEQRRERFDQFRQAMDQLRPEQREQVRSQMEGMFREQMMQPVKAYFSLPSEQRTAFLDQQINAMEQRRKEMEAFRASQSQGKDQGNAQGKAAPRGRPDFRNMSAADRNQWRKQRLDQSKPEDRAAACGLHGSHAQASRGPRDAGHARLRRATCLATDRHRLFGWQ